MPNDKQKAVIGVTVLAAALGVGTIVKSVGGSSEVVADAGVSIDASYVDDAGHLQVTDLLTEEVEQGKDTTAEVTLDAGYLPGEPVLSGAAYGCFNVSDMTLEKVESRYRFTLKARNNCTKRRFTAYVPLKFKGNTP